MRRGWLWTGGAIGASLAFLVWLSVRVTTDALRDMHRADWYKPNPTFPGSETARP